MAQPGRSIGVPKHRGANKNGAFAAPFSLCGSRNDQSLCQVWLLQISPPSTQPLILSEAPETEALPE